MGLMPVNRTGELAHRQNWVGSAATRRAVAQPRRRSTQDNQSGTTGTKKHSVIHMQIYKSTTSLDITLKIVQ